MNFNLEEKASVLKWLISAQGVPGIPRLKDAYDFTIEDCVLRGATLDDEGMLVPVNTHYLYYKDGRCVVGSELQNTTVVNVSASQLLSGNGVELLPAPPKGYFHVVDSFEMAVMLPTQPTKQFLKFRTYEQ